ncbi:hypothetical protein MAR_000269 [Mya arenaria]|uniref:Uncharacterized protein n=1 Tax=Mya arenaria TaxID=6604 RepID=A0ABY7FGR8_MYAAR|nr:hypothetical protein MAR_000269 [Mya arenaria]
MDENILKKICSKAKLDRDKGFEDITNFLNEAEDAAIPELEKKFADMLSDSTAEWETKHGALMGAKALIKHGRSSEDFSQMLISKVGDVLGSLCAKFGPDIYITVKANVLEGIATNLERDPFTDSVISEQDETERLIEKLSSSPRGEKCIIEGLGQAFNPFVDQDLLDLIFRALTHTNRFVRETGYYVCSSLVACGCVQEGSESALLDEDNAILKFGHQFADYLGRGLADNWSQVRLASSVATRKFLQSLPSDEARHQFFPVLLPRMCLNRYYVAEGVRIYSQDTWKLVAGTEGKQLVEKYIQQVVDYYIEATEADNHAVSKEVVQSEIPRLLDALLVCFSDDSWPVRDAACVACGNFVLCFPEDSRSSLPALYPLFFSNLQDNIPSVRQGAALALANVVKAYGEECFNEIYQKVKEGLAGVEKQPENAEKYSSLDKGPATYGVAKKLRDNDQDLHTDRQMYSCGSLAPKMGRGKREGGCMDHKFRKDPEPWELADGCINVVAELAQLQKFAAKVAELLPLVVKAVSFEHYTHHLHMKETLCQRLPHIATGLGKRYFKMYLEIFFDAIFTSLGCDNALTSTAAHNCLSELAKFLGPSILKGRIEQYNPRYLERLPPDIDHPGMMSGHAPMMGARPPPLAMGSHHPPPFSGLSPTAFPGASFPFPGPPGGGAPGFPPQGSDTTVFPRAGLGLSNSPGSRNGNMPQQDEGAVISWLL